MMDEYIDRCFSSSSWSDANAKERSSWDYYEPVQQNRVLTNSLEVYEDDRKNSPGSIIRANHIMDSLAVQYTSSLVIGGELEYGIDKNLDFQEARHERDDQNCNGNLSSSEKMNGSLELGNFGLRYDTAIPTLDSVNLSSPKRLPSVGGMQSSLPFIDGVQVGGNGGELSEVQRSLRDLQTYSPSPELWLPPTYDEVSSLSPVMGQQRIQGFCLQGVNDIDTIGNRYVGMDKILQFDNLPASIATKGKQGLQNHALSCFSAEPQTTTTTVGLPSLQQNASAISTGVSNGTGKPRVRARRGQATDPHSIAERLRREKIAERMKKLQELIPNSNKTDKASMLDEIIDYVKFLQLQVKVLSMSRLGAAGAVLPLITDGQAEGANGLSFSPQSDQGVEISLNPDQIAFEEEIVKLMESNVTMAMQYLQSKGLCLMPIALAAAISSSGKAFEEKHKLGFGNSTSNNSSSSSSSSTSTSSLPNDAMNQMSLNSSNIIVGKPIIGESIMIGNVCNGALKQEVRNNCKVFTHPDK